ncbi:MAG: phosphotransferase, partial [Lachnospiraceae bacterium]|nr:phosphotransferase [Lachnospiraceae bacterium]
QDTFEDVWEHRYERLGHNILDLMKTEEEQKVYVRRCVNNWNKEKLDAWKEKQREKKYSSNALTKVLENAADGTAGQSKFIKNAMNSYMAGVDITTKRSMIASVMRDMRPNAAEDEEDEIAIGEKVDEHENDIQDPIEKKKLKEAGRYLGSLIKGAGPLFQKLIQGMPTTGLPKEIKKAINVTKSGLLPIPETYANAQFYSMIKRSKGQVTRIEKVKSLGAASVGEAYLCKLYGPNLPEEGREVVIKLLRPDVRNRMKKEEVIMKKAAADTDENGGMLATYEGQLERIKKELDLTIEAKNCEEGHVYDNILKDVKSMNINNLIEPTTNSLVLEKADGISVDRYMEELNAYRKEALEPVMKYNEWEKKWILKQYNPADIEKYAASRQKLQARLAEIERRHSHLANLAKVWVEEGLFKGGFYHGDLHSGNIMINDDEATIIDYGNATKLSEDDRLEITRMMAAAAAGSPDEYLAGFVKFYKGKKPLTNVDKIKLRNEFEKLFKMGGPEDAGVRIAASLLRAQEMGYALPPEIYNFSQCQMRLQNAITELKEIEAQYRKDIENLDDMESKYTSATDVIGNIHRKFNNKEDFDDKDMLRRECVNLQRSMGDVDKDELLSEVIKNKKVKGNAKKHIEPVDEREDFDKKYMGGMLGISNKLTHEVKTGKGRPDPDRPGKLIYDTKTVKVTKKYVAGFKRAYLDLMEKTKGVGKDEWNNGYEKEKETLREMMDLTSVTEFGMQQENPLASIISSADFRMLLFKAVNERDEEAFKEFMDIFEVKLERIEQAEKALISLRKEQDSIFGSQSKIESLKEDFYQKYKAVLSTLGKSTPQIAEIRSYMENSLPVQEPNRVEGMRRELEKLCTVFASDTEETKTAKDKLIPAFNEYVEAKRTELQDADNEEKQNATKKKLDDFMDLVFKVTLARLQVHNKAFEGQAPVKKELKGFVEIMGDVLKTNWTATINRLGLGKIKKYANGMDDDQQEKIIEAAAQAELEKIRNAANAGNAGNAENAGNVGGNQ